MKFLFYLVVILLPTMTIAQKQKQQLSPKEIAKLADGPDDVSIECAGTCGCSLQGELGGENAYVACSCADCMMNITISTQVQNNDEISVEKKEYSLVDAKVDIPFIREYFDFAAPEFKLQSVNIVNDEEGKTVVFNYLNKDGAMGSVIFAKAQNSKTKYQIECQGSCGCSVIYSFSTNSASCGCSDCIMIVNEIKSE